MGRKNVVMQISQQAWTFLGIETFLFLILLFSLYKANRQLRPILKALARSLRLSEDQFGDESNFVTSARTRYRRAAEHIEDVDAQSIAAGELSGVELLHVGKWRVNIGGLNELIGSAPGVFITIGLLGTFVGLAANLQELGQLLNTDSGAPGEVVGRLGNVLEPMSTAFLSSLGGVFYSLLFWLVGLLVGSNRLLEETEDLLTAYLEQVVQADCNRFSLVRASVERMELALADFMSRFANDVSVSIDKAITRKVGQVFDSIEQGSKAMSLYAETFSQGVSDLETSGKVFAAASDVIQKSEFANTFGEAAAQFSESVSTSEAKFNSLSSCLEDSRASFLAISKEYNDTYKMLDSVNVEISRLTSLTNQGISVQAESTKEISEASKQLRAARLAVGRENKETNELSIALAERLRQESQHNQDIKDLLGQKIEVDSKVMSVIKSSLQSLVSVLSSLDRNSAPVNEINELLKRESSSINQEVKNIASRSQSILDQVEKISSVDR